jgi:hypothetical protein
MEEQHTIRDNNRLFVFLILMWDRFNQSIVLCMRRYLYYKSKTVQREY